MTRIEELRAEVEAEEAAARGAALTEDEAAEAALLARREAAREERAAVEKKRRAADMATREKAARAKSTDRRAIIRGLDLVGLFPVGIAPPIEDFPGRGVVILRSPPPERMKALHTEVEHKARAVADIYADLVVESAVDPDPKDLTEGAKLRAFLEAYPNACLAAGDMAAKLGGSRAAADKRGHG